MDQEEELVLDDDPAAEKRLRPLAKRQTPMRTLSGTYLRTTLTTTLVG